MIDDARVINIMIDGGEKVCQEAIKKWYNNEYRLDENTIKEKIKEWNDVQSRIRPLAKLLKQ